MIMILLNNKSENYDKIQIFFLYAFFFNNKKNHIF
jgi:hypothetical protein